MEVVHTQKHPFYTAWRNAMTMLKNRGYTFEEEAEVEEGDFVHMLTERGEHHQLCVREREDAAQKLLMYCTMEPKVGIKTVRKLHGALKSSDIRNALVIYETSITPFAKQAIKGLTQEGITIETFRTIELAVDIIQHKYVPKHTVLTGKEKAEVLDKYDKNWKQYPKILQGDPIVRYFGLDKGDMIKIERFYENYGEYVTYRVVT
jgi:DNA-directed RNA polymerases I, II, and III subunit RPABC1